MDDSLIFAWIILTLLYTVLAMKAADAHPRTPGLYSTAQHFPESLWPKGSRSSELTPLYIEKFAGWRMSSRTTAHEYWELICNCGHTGTLSAGSKVVPLPQHQVVLIAPGIPHMEYSDHKMDIVWLGLHGSMLSAFDAQGSAECCSEGLCELAERTWLFSRQTGGEIGPELDGMTRSVIGSFRRIVESGMRDNRGNFTERAIRAIHTHMAEPISVGGIAQELGCSEGHFHREFKATTGRTPVQYWTRIRIEHAMRLLTGTTWPVFKVAEVIGYDDQFYFSRVFKKAIGVSPATYRQRISSEGSFSSSAS